MISARGHLKFADLKFAISVTFSFVLATVGVDLQHRLWVI